MLPRLLSRAFVPFLLCALGLTMSVHKYVPVPPFVLTALAQSDVPTLHLSPPYVGEGGALRVSGYGFPLDSTFALQLQAADGSQTHALGEITTDPDHGTFGPVTLPLAPAVQAGAYQLLVTTPDFEEIARLPVTVSPGPAITLAPNGGAPGTEIQVTVQHVLTGALRIDYAGLAVLGPTAVEGGTFVGSFVVPGDRPDPLGASTTVAAVNTINGHQVARGEAAFQSQAGGATRYQFQNVTIPQPPGARGETFIIQGQISPPPAGDLDDYAVTAMWQSAGGLTFPIGLDAAIIQPSGAFSIAARLPSLMAGDPAPAEQGDQLMLQFLAADAAPTVYNVDDTPVTVPGTVLNIKVVEAGTSNEIKGAKVRIVPANVLLYDNASQALTHGMSQLQATLDPNGDGGLTDEEKQLLLQAKAMCALLNTKQANEDPVPPSIDPTLESMFIIPLQQQFSLQNSVQESVGAAGGTANVTPHLADNDHIVIYTIIVDAIAQGYGEVDDNNKVVFTTRRVSYNKQTGIYSDMLGKPVSNPFVIALPELTTEHTSPLGPVPLYWQGLPEDVVGKAGTVYGVYYSTLGVPSNTQVPAQTSVYVRAYLEPGKHKLLAENGLKLLLDGKEVGVFDLYFHPNVNCSLYVGDLDNYVPAYEGIVQVPDVHLLKPGVHAVAVQAKLKDGTTHIYSYGLKIKPLPAWFLQGGFKRQTVTWSPSQVQLSAIQFDQEDDPNPLQATLPHYGPVNNEAGLDYGVYQQLSSNGSQTPLKNNGGTRAIAWNTNPGKVAIAGQNTAASVQAAATIEINESKKLDRQTQNLGKVTIFGVPYIADVSVGLKVWFEAALEVNGTVTVDALDQAPAVDLTVRPSATAGADAYGDLTILFDILADAQLHFLPAINVNMPVRFTEQGVSDADICFKYRLDYQWIVRIGCVPEVCAFGECVGGWCLVDESGTENIFAGNVPTSNVCQPWASIAGANPAAVSQGDPAPPSLKPALATDGLGNTFAIWRALDGRILVSRYDGMAWRRPTALTEAGASPAAAPGIAFYAPNRAVAVWVASTIDEEPASPLSAEAAVQAQYIAYAEWDGTSWSQPETLTPPNSGDGGVVIAGCGTPAQPCMVNGTATAAWVRNVGTTLEEHRFRLFYATFANGEWNTATEAAPMRYEGTEGQPALAYHNNRATLIWVRDDDRNYSTATDRRLWLRVLARDGAFEQLDELPTNVVAASLAAKQDGALYIAFTVATSDNLLGAQSDLMVAFQSCTPACTWQTRLLRDGYGRSLRAERALVTVDAQDRATITFRGLGFGPDAQGNLAIYPQDPPGMVQQTGELVQVYFDPNQAVVAPMYLTQDGAVNWQPAALFDNHTNTTLAMAVNVPALGPLQANVSHAAQQTLPAEPLVFGALPAMPDFAVVGSEVDSLYATSKISITLANVGAPWVDSSATPLQLVATWDGGPGVGLPAAAVELTALEEAMTTIVLDLAAPGGLEQPHQLVITANPGQLIPEANGDNNSLTLTLGGLPAPGGLTSASTDGTALVLLSWDASPDARVAGYRIYRATDGGALLPLGSTPVAGYVDVTAEVGPSYQYAVTAYTAMGAESPLDQSEVAAVTIGTATPAFYLPRIMR